MCACQISGNITLNARSYETCQSHSQGLVKWEGDVDQSKFEHACRLTIDTDSDTCQHIKILAQFWYIDLHDLTNVPLNNS